MNPALLLSEIALGTAILCGLHALKPRLGLAPFYLVVGLLLAMLFVTGGEGTSIRVELFLGQEVGFNYALFLSMLLSAIVVVYVLDGTRPAQAFLVGILAVQLLHYGAQELMVWHATQSAVEARHAMPIAGDFHERVSSVGAFIADFAVLIISYQLLANRLRWLPTAPRLVLSMLLATAADALAFSGLHALLIGPVDHIPLLEKVQGAAAASIPTAAYLSVALKRGWQNDESVAVRPIFDVLSLRRRLLETQALLEETERRYSDIKDSFSRYVSSDVVEAIAADPSKVKLGGEERDVTVLFADIESYSTLAESMSPTEVIGFLNDYFQEMTGVILDCNGMINEFEGDGILAIFGAPLELPNHASHAFLAARKMLERVESINQRWEASGQLARWRLAGVQRLRVRIGLHSGAVVSGNVGSKLRMKYAVIGDTVNVAARVETLNKTLGTTLLLSSTTLEKLRPEERTNDLVSLGSHPVKGRTGVLDVWSLEDTSMNGLGSDVE